MIAFAELTNRIDHYNREAESRADRLADIPPTQNAKVLVDEIVYWDDLYRKELEKRKYLQEHNRLPIEEPVRDWKDRYEIPVGGAELAITVRNLSKNVSTWKARVGNDRFPDAPSKLAMYEALHKEARAKLSAARAAEQLQKNH